LKNVGLGTNSVCVIFSVFWPVHSRSEVLSACKILDGEVIPSLKYGEKRVSSKTCIRQDAGLAAKPPPCNMTVQLLN